MIRYEVRQREYWTKKPNWTLVTTFENISDARDYWSTAKFEGIEAALVKVQCTETYEHYHSADGKEAY